MDGALLGILRSDRAGNYCVFPGHSTDEAIDEVKSTLNNLTRLCMQKFHTKAPYLVNPLSIEVQGKIVPLSNTIDKTLSEVDNTIYGDPLNRFVPRVYAFCAQAYKIIKSWLAVLASVGKADVLDLLYRETREPNSVHIAKVIMWVSLRRDNFDLVLSYIMKLRSCLETWVERGLIGQSLQKESDSKFILGKENKVVSRLVTTMSAKRYRESTDWIQGTSSEYREMVLSDLDYIRKESSNITMYMPELLQYVPQPATYSCYVAAHRDMFYRLYYDKETDMVIDPMKCMLNESECHIVP